jgi:hypothetical protein
MADKPPGITVTQYEPHDLEVECGVTAVTCLIVTHADGRGVLLKLCRRHVCRLSILLIETLE